jgi:hypothetical protein
MIILEATAGLCNRLRAIDSAILLANDNNQTLHVKWRLNSDCNCKLSHLFDIPKDVVELEEEEWGTLKVIKEKLIIGGHYLGLGNYYESSRVRRLEPSNEKAWSSLQKHRTTHLRTCHDFYKKSLPMDTFKPKAFLMDQIEQYAGSDCVGVHVRRTDNHASMARSSLQGFSQMMHAEIANDLNCRFFLATDEPEVEAEFKHEFGDKIQTHTKRSLDRNDALAIEDAVIDLFALGNCRKIIGSQISSFTEYASHINNIECITAS